MDKKSVENEIRGLIDELGRGRAGKMFIRDSYSSCALFRDLKAVKCIQQA